MEPEDKSSSEYGLVAFKYLPDSEVLCIIFKCGEIMTLSPLDNTLEIVGVVDSGITAAQWSPDEQLVIISTNQQTLIEMTMDFQVLTEFPIHVDYFGEDEQQNIGWGKKETQFHGSEGKQAAVFKKLETDLNLSPNDDGNVRISWKGDGNQFVVSAIAPSKKRFLRVYNRDAVLQSTSEFVHQLEHSLCWRYYPSPIKTNTR